MKDSPNRIIVICTALALLALLGMAGPLLSQCIYQPAPADVDDASINAYYPTRGLNYPDELAAATSDGFFGQMRSVIRFPDLSSLPYPASSMKLQLYGIPRDPFTPKRGDISLFQVLQDWGETTITYNNQPAHYPVPVGTVSPDIDRWYQWDITGLYNAWRSGALPNFGLKLINSHQSVRATGINFKSSDQPDPTLRPRLVSADPCGLTVAIDVKPGSDPNSINPRSEGRIPVAILTTSTADGDPLDFDAWDLDPTSLAFGPGGAEIAHANGHAEDADGDGDLDMVVHFRTRQTGIACGDTEATLTGQTFGGRAIEGSDSVKTRCGAKAFRGALVSGTAPNDPFADRTRRKASLRELRKKSEAE